METKDYFSPIFTLSHIDKNSMKLWLIRKNGVSTSKGRGCALSCASYICKGFLLLVCCMHCMSYLELHGWCCILILVFKLDFKKDFTLLNEKFEFCNFASIFASLKGLVHHPTNPLCWTFAKSDFAPLWPLARIAKYWYQKGFIQGYNVQ